MWKKRNSCPTLKKKPQIRFFKIVFSAGITKDFVTNCTNIGGFL